MAIESMGAWSGNTALTQWGADQAQAIDVIIARLESRVSRVFETGKGALETGLEDTKTQVSDLFELLKNPPTFNPDPIVERLASLQEIAHSIWTAMSSDMSTFFFNSIKNKSLKFADFFRDLGNSILKIWTDLLAKMMARWMENMANMESGGATSESKWLTVIKAAVGIFGAIGGGGQGTGIMTEGANAGISAGYDQGILSDGANAGIYAGYGGDSYLSGGVVHALGGLNLGPGEVPVIAHTRERILSREENKDYSQGKQQRGNMVFSQNFNITATDAKSFMSYRKEIVACVKQDILRNTEIRRVIQAYGSRR